MRCYIFCVILLLLININSSASMQKWNCDQFQTAPIRFWCKYTFWRMTVEAQNLVADAVNAEEAAEEVVEMAMDVPKEFDSKLMNGSFVLVDDIENKGTTVIRWISAAEKEATGWVESEAKNLLHIVDGVHVLKEKKPVEVINEEKSPVSPVLNPKKISIAKKHKKWATLEKAKKVKYQNLHEAENQIWGVNAPDVKYPEKIESIESSAFTDTEYAANATIEVNATKSFLERILPKSWEELKLDMGITLNLTDYNSTDNLISANATAGALTEGEANIVHIIVRVLEVIFVIVMFIIIILLLKMIKLLLAKITGVTIKRKKRSNNDGQEGTEMRNLSSAPQLPTIIYTNPPPLNPYPTVQC